MRLVCPENDAEDSRWMLAHAPAGSELQARGTATPSTYMLVQCELTALFEKNGLLGISRASRRYLFSLLI